MGLTVLVDSDSSEVIDVAYGVSSGSLNSEACGSRQGLRDIELRRRLYQAVPLPPALQRVGIGAIGSSAEAKLR
jgi:hypothetical protein